MRPPDSEPLPATVRNPARALPSLDRNKAQVFNVVDGLLKQGADVVVVER